MHVYADDTQLFVHANLTGDDIDCTVGFLNQNLETVAQWSRKNDLETQKCSYTLLGTHNQIDVVSSVAPIVVVIGQQINTTPTVRNLGLLLNSSLSFEKHVDSKIRKCYASLKYLYKLKPYLNEAVRVRVTNSIV